jgi:DNA polymerase III delta prime subunit
MFGRKEHTLWTEKYRPTDQENYIGNAIFKESIAKYIRKNDIPNIILHGVPGTGKTTAAKMIVQNMNCDYLYLNGSDNNGIETVRTTIKDFASAASFKPLKVVILDDCATLTDQAQQGLLNIVESFSKNTRFIFTTNHLDRLIEALKSRCLSFKIEPPSKTDVGVHLMNMLEKESVEAEAKQIGQIVKKYYPDIRKCVSITQECVVDNKLSLDFGNISNKSYLNDILQQLKIPTNNSWREVRTILSEANATDFVELFRFLYDNVDEYANDTYEETIFAIAEAQYQHYFVPDKEINIMNMILKILKTKQ